MVLGQTPLLFVAVTMCVTMNNLPKYVTNEKTKNSFLQLSSLVKNLSRSVNRHDHSKAFLLPTGKETAESLLFSGKFYRQRSFNVEYKLALCNSSVKSQRTHCNCILVYGRKELVFKHAAGFVVTLITPSAESVSLEN